VNDRWQNVLDGSARWAVVQGDCLDVLRDMPDGCVDAVVTDPPYGHKNNDDGDLIHRRECALGKAKVAEAPRAIANDGVEAHELYRTVMPILRRILKPGCCCCCCAGGGGGDPQLANWSLWMAESFSFKQIVVWDKGPMGMGWHYRRSWEAILVGQKPGAACAWYDETNTVENIIRPGQYGVRKIIPDADEHPTPKPWELARHFIQLHSRPNDVILDSFAGRGWVGEAAIRTGRRYIGVEIDPFWAAKSRERLVDVESVGDLFMPATARARIEPKGVLL